MTIPAMNMITAIELLSSVSGPVERWRRASIAKRTAVMAQRAICIQNSSTRATVSPRSTFGGKLRSCAANHTAKPVRNTRLVRCARSASSSSTGGPLCSPRARRRAVMKRFSSGRT